ncbi:MAG: hypothetical protein NVSMB65_03450 [Chloroflexota bacterium]
MHEHAATRVQHVQHVDVEVTVVQRETCLQRRSVGCFDGGKDSLVGGHEICRAEQVAALHPYIAGDTVEGALQVGAGTIRKGLAQKEDGNHHTDGDTQHDDAADRRR